MLVARAERAVSSTETDFMRCLCLCRNICFDITDSKRSTGELNNYNEKIVFTFINTVAKRSNVSRLCGDSLTKVNTSNCSAAVMISSD
ncbi:unnamed protein product [Brugia pahangi]|uniref:Kinesin motor domain-containing protein n=1 Tax=Brugia pahangi TaxID=6280 RepID=A0A0N4TA42_BRUPA|nr:unnamed protein product [Brugia pahangi]